MKDARLYSIDLSMHEPNELEVKTNWHTWVRNGLFPHPHELISYGVGIPINDLTYEDWKRYIKQLFDWLRKVHGKERFIVLCFLSKSHKKHMRNKCKPSAWHAHLLVIGSPITKIINWILEYWDTKKRYNTSVHCWYDKCDGTKKLMYDAEQAEGTMVCISPSVTINDLKKFGMDIDIIETVKQGFQANRHINAKYIVQMMYDYLLKVQIENH